MATPIRTGFLGRGTGGYRGVYKPPPHLYIKMTHTFICLSAMLTIEVKQMSKYTIDGHGNTRLTCLGNCGSYGDGWGARLGYCTTCKHLNGACNGVGCKTSAHA